MEYTSSLQSVNPDFDVIDTLFVCNPVDELADEGITNRMVFKIFRDLDQNPPMLLGDGYTWERPLPADVRLSWSYLVTRQDPPERYLPLCLKILNAVSPLAVQILADSTSRDNSFSCLTVATKAIKVEMKSRMPFMKRYVFAPGPPLHSTKTSLVRRAFDHAAAVDYKAVFRSLATNPQDGSPAILAFYNKAKKPFLSAMKKVREFAKRRAAKPHFWDIDVKRRYFRACGALLTSLVSVAFSSLSLSRRSLA